MAFDLAAVRALVRQVNFDLFGIEVTLTPPEPDDRVETRGVWMTMPTELTPAGLSARKADQRFVMAFRRDLQPTIKRSTRVWAPPPEGGEVTGWRFDGNDRIEASVVLVVLVRDDGEVP